MKKFCSKLLVVTAVACAVVLAGCGRQMPEQDGKKQEQESKKQEKEAAYEASIISDYEWQASGDGSIIVCDEDGAFKYYRSAEDLTDSYYEGTYEFYFNCNTEEVTVSDVNGFEMLTEKPVDGAIVLEAYGVAVVRK